jgi:hypothetical protein
MTTRVFQLSRKCYAASVWVNSRTDDMTLIRNLFHLVFVAQSVCALIVFRPHSRAQESPKISNDDITLKTSRYLCRSSLRHRLRKVPLHSSTSCDYPFHFSLTNTFSRFRLKIMFVENAPAPFLPPHVGDQPVHHVVSTHSNDTRLYNNHCLFEIKARDSKFCIIY